LKKTPIILAVLLCVAMNAISHYKTMLPILGAKIYFSDKPFVNNHKGDKPSFKSGDFIYGRMELQDNQTLFDAFKMSINKPQYYYLCC